MMSLRIVEESYLAPEVNHEKRTLAVDVGYGFVKAVSSAGQRVCFPSVTAPAGTDLGFDFGSNSSSYRVSIRKLDGHQSTYMVGEAAQNSFLASGFLGTEKPAELHDLLLLTAAYLTGAGSTGPFPVQYDLAVGLPLAFYKAQKEALKSRLERLAAWVSVDGGEERYISFRKVLVIPQGAGVVFAQGLTKDQGFAAVVDIGQYTTDYLLIDRKAGRPIVEASGSIEAGCHLVTHQIAQAYLAKTGRPLPVGMENRILEEVAETGYTVFRGGKLDLSGEYREAVRQAAGVITKQVLSAWRKFADSIGVTYLAGGGALLFREHMVEAFSNPVVVEEPVFANALGYLKMLIK